MYGSVISLAVVAIGRSLIGAAHFGEFIIDAYGCHWDSFYNYQEWTSACGCECPTQSECDVDGGGRGLGGFDTP